MSNINPFDDIEDMMIHARELAQMATEMVDALIGTRPRTESDCQAFKPAEGRLGALADRSSAVTEDLIEAKRNISRFFDLTTPGNAEVALDSATSNPPPKRCTDWNKASAGKWIRL